MDYRKYSAEDFAFDEKFQKWVLDPDHETNVFWQGWVNANPRHKFVIEDAIQLVQAAGLSKDTQANEAFLSVWNNIAGNVAQNAPSKQFWNSRYAAAAAIALLVTASILLWRTWSNDSVVEYRTAYGEVKEFVLQDGSTVTLNSNSHLTVNNDWSESPVREVTLEGEAFFDVVRTTDLKGFDVETAENVKISVLGTSFNVNTRQSQVKVYLASGKVKVNSSIGEAMMNPGDVVLYKSGNSSLMINRNSADAPQLLSWKEQVFIFNDTPVSEIVRELEDNYGFQVIVENNELNDKRITAKIPRKDADVLLKVLSETLSIKIEREGNRLTLK